MFRECAEGTAWYGMAILPTHLRTVVKFFAAKFSTFKYRGNQQARWLRFNPKYEAAIKCN